MTTPRTTASALAASSARGKTVATVAERRQKGCRELPERFTQQACARRGQPLGTKARLVPVTDYGVTTAAPGHRGQVVLARQAEQVCTEVASATRRPRMPRAR